MAMQPQEASARSDQNPPHPFHHIFQKAQNSSWSLMASSVTSSNTLRSMVSPAQNSPHPKKNKTNPTQNRLNRPPLFFSASTSQSSKNRGPRHLLQLGTNLPLRTLGLAGSVGSAAGRRFFDFFWFWESGCLGGGGGGGLYDFLVFGLLFLRVCWWFYPEGCFIYSFCQSNPIGHLSRGRFIDSKSIGECPWEAYTG